MLLRPTALEEQRIKHPSILYTANPLSVAAGRGWSRSQLTLWREAGFTPDKSPVRDHVHETEFKNKLLGSICVAVGGLGGGVVDIKLETEDTKYNESRQSLGLKHDL